MSRTLPATPSKRVAVAAAATMVAALTSSIVGVDQAQAVVDPACTASGPVTAGQPVTGLTVSHGVVPDGFTGEILGTINDGIAPGLDMIIARLSSDEIDRVGGIWAGMSGSPVYAEDGTLIGAVAYGLAFGPSPVAGITPAKDMLAVKDLAGAGSTPAPTKRVDIPAGLQSRMVADGAASAPAADQGLLSLKTPLAVSGATSQRTLKQVKKRLDIPRVRVYQAGAAADASGTGDPGSIVPGGNLAVSVAYGDVAFTGIGTVTAVCDGKVVGFGHPFTFNGPTSLTMESADAVYVQEDPIFAGFKVANPTGPVGTISQDRLAGVAGATGAIPDATKITSTARTDNDGDGAFTSAGEKRTGESFVTDPQFLPEVTFFATLFNQDRVFDRFSPGTGKGNFTITGSSTESGPFTLTRGNRFQSDFDISASMAFEAPDALFSLLRNKYTNVDFDDVTVNSTLSPKNKVFTIKRVEQKVAGKWVKLPSGSRIKAKSGQTLRFRVGLDSFRNEFGTVNKKLRVEVPKISGRGFGELIIAGGRSFFFRGTKATSFDGLVENLANAPRNDDLIARFDVRQSNGPRIRQTTTKRLDTVVRGFRFYGVRVGAGGGSVSVPCKTASRGC